METERTNPDACLSTPFDTILSYTTIPPVEIKCNLKERTDDPPIASEQMVGTGGKGVHLLEKGIAVAHGLNTAYDIGKTVATAAAPLIAMAL